MRWYRSFYWRIGFSFVVLVVLVLVAQSALSTYLGAPASPRSPNNLAAIIAADIGSLLAADPALDFERHVRQEYGTGPQLIYVVMKDGRVVANTEAPLDPGVQRSIEALLRGSREQPSMPGPPIISAPVQAHNELRGMVLLPPAPGVSPYARQVERLLSLPGTAVVILATLVAAPLVFGAARRRLRALEVAAERLGAGDPTARAPEGGGDEIARLAVAFNRMADDLHARDTALRESDRLRRQMLADVSHELRTPLTTMLGYLDTLRMPQMSLDAETRERYLTTVERETRRLDRLVRDLLDLARLQNDAASMHVRLFAIAQVFKHVTERHEQETSTRGISVLVMVEDAADQDRGRDRRAEAGVPMPRRRVR